MMMYLSVSTQWLFFIILCFLCTILYITFSSALISAGENLNGFVVFMIVSAICCPIKKIIKQLHQYFKVNNHTIYWNLQQILENASALEGVHAFLLHLRNDGLFYIIYVSSKSFGFVFSVEVLKTFVMISDTYFQLRNQLFSLCKPTHL